MKELPLNTVQCGDCREVMATFPADSIDLVVTSPPYWGLRDYSSDSLIWGGDRNHNHFFELEYVPQRGNRDKDFNERWGNSSGQRKQEKKNIIDSQRGFCECGAWKGQLGLEPHPQMFVDHLVDICREIKRVIKPKGSFWLNLGDTYYSNPSNQQGPQVGARGSNNEPRRKNRNLRTNWLQPKQLLGIPWRVATTLQDDGWILRNCVIWYKPNHMPESVRDRLTKSYEFFFFFVKQRKYYFDLDSIREPYSEVSIKRLSQPSIMSQMGGDKQEALYGDAPGNGNRPADILKGLAQKYNTKYDGSNQYQQYQDRMAQARKEGKPHDNALGNPLGKNPGDMWEIPTYPFPGSHFAVFPPDLIEPIIKASSPVNGTILDPFAGSGTALRVARKLGRKYIGIELNPEYAAMCERRVRSDTYTPPPEGVSTLWEALEK